MSRSTRPTLVRCLVLALACASPACGRPTDGATPATQAGAQTERLATIGIAQALLHETDVLEGLGDRPAAIQRAERVLTLELDGSDPLREPLRLDAYGRLAELQLASGELDQADVAIERGLREVTARSYFEARLYVVRGRVLEARAAAVRASDAALADAQLRAALAAHERSLAINEELLRATPGSPGAAGRP